jgi:predicted O-methyltransferase YrrM
MASTLQTAPVLEVLGRLHAQADREDAEAKRRVRDRESQLGHRLTQAQRYELYGDAPLAIIREVGELYYLLVVTHRPLTIVEFGASHGISTIYLAAGIRDAGGAGRALITTEILPHKAALARRNLRECGLQEIVEMRVGDALETLADGPSAPDMVVLDGRNDLYVPVLDLLAPRLPAGALVVADLNTDDPDVLAYQRGIREPGSGFFSTELPLDAGIELSVRLESRA